MKRILFYHALAMVMAVSVVQVMVVITARFPQPPFGTNLVVSAGGAASEQAANVLARPSARSHAASENVSHHDWRWSRTTLLVSSLFWPILLMIALRERRQRKPGAPVHRQHILTTGQSPRAATTPAPLELIYSISGRPRRGLSLGGGKLCSIYPTRPVPKLPWVNESD